MSDLQDLSALAPKEIWLGVTARVVRGDRITMGIVELEPGVLVPEHQHANEQLGVVIQGVLTLTVGEETRRLGPGGTWRIRPGTPHSARAGEQGAVVVDVFSPPRSDWEQLQAKPAAQPAWPPPAVNY